MGTDKTRPSGQPKRPSESNEALVRALAGGSYVKTHRAFLFNVGDGEAILLSYLIDLYDYLMRHGAGGCPGGWFYCRVEKIEREINQNKRGQSRFLGNLRDRGFIEMKRKGCPPKRHIRINMDAVATMVADYNEMTDKSKQEKGYL